MLDRTHVRTAFGKRSVYGVFRFLRHADFRHGFAVFQCYGCGIILSSYTEPVADAHTDDFQILRNISVRLNQAHRVNILARVCDKSARRGVIAEHQPQAVSFERIGKRVDIYLRVFSFFIEYAVTVHIVIVQTQIELTVRSEIFSSVLNDVFNFFRCAVKLLNL